MKHVISLLILSLIAFSTDAQITSRLTIQSGNDVNFNFQLLDHYENGVEYLNWTRATVFFEDLGDPLNEWKLSVKATTPNIVGNAGNTLPLNTIEFSVTGDDPAATYNNDIAHAVLTAVDTNLIENGQQTLIAGVLTNIDISYYCGRSLYVADNSLLGSTPDYYYVEVQLTLGPM
jgi:hypothetical protein